MNTVFRTSLAIALLAVVSACAMPQRTASRGDYRAAVSSELQRLGIPESDVTGMSYIVERAQDSRAVTDRTVWIRLKTCRGYLVMPLGGGNEVTETYATGNCRVP